MVADSTEVHSHCVLVMNVEPSAAERRPDDPTDLDIRGSDRRQSDGGTQLQV
jgi:hypothetical protein